VGLLHRPPLWASSIGLLRGPPQWASL
jgi:hypothetical protein